MGVFWWWNHKNTPISFPNPGNSQRDGFLPALRIAPTGEKKGIIVLHGGYDSFLEEWYLMLKYLAQAGYESIGFEGPGQGAALIKAGLAMDIR
jgi:alpha-beta hydrolase superfamily lysophospholipase